MRYIVVFDKRHGWAVAHWWSQSRRPDATLQEDVTPTFLVTGEWSDSHLTAEKEADRLNGAKEADRVTNPTFDDLENGDLFHWVSARGPGRFQMEKIDATHYRPVTGPNALDMCPAGSMGDSQVMRARPAAPEPKEAK